MINYKIKKSSKLENPPHTRTASNGQKKICQATNLHGHPVKHKFWPWYRDAVNGF